jgi:predicted metal-binding membrane protein
MVAVAQLPDVAPRKTRARASERAFFAVAALLFAASMAVTILGCGSMSTMGEMPMPGGWTMSMAWMPGQTWTGAAASFLGMWVVMIVAMMLPPLLPMLQRYRGAVGRTGERRPLRPDSRVSSMAAAASRFARAFALSGSPSSNA